MNIEILDSIEVDGVIHALGMAPPERRSILFGETVHGSPVVLELPLPRMLYHVTLGQTHSANSRGRYDGYGIGNYNRCLAAYGMDADWGVDPAVEKKLYFLPWPNMTCSGKFLFSICRSDIQVPEGIPLEDQVSTVASLNWEVQFQYLHGAEPPYRAGYEWLGCSDKGRYSGMGGGLDKYYSKWEKVSVPEAMHYPWGKIELPFTVDNILPKPKKSAEELMAGPRSLKKKLAAVADRF